MKNVTRRAFASGIALLPVLRLSSARAQTGVTPAEARAIANVRHPGVSEKQLPLPHGRSREADWY
jgi:hypothetical protein